MTVELLTKMSSNIQNQQLRLFSRVDLATKLNILKSQNNIFHKLKSLQTDTENTILTLASLVLAIKKEIHSLDKVNLNLAKVRGKKSRSKYKREKLLGYWPLVLNLKEQEKMSYRDIAKYLKKYHRFEVAHSTIYEIYKEIKGENYE